MKHLHCIVVFSHASAKVLEAADFAGQERGSTLARKAKGSLALKRGSQEDLQGSLESAKKEGKAAKDQSD